jgi:hypothetical protein
MTKWEDDLVEAYRLLDGWIEHDDDGAGLPRSKRFKPDSSCEKKARMKLARLLRRRRINGQILDQLAALFDPRRRIRRDGKAHPDFLHISEYEIIIKKRVAGQPEAHITNSAITQQVWNQMQTGATLDASFDTTANQFNLSYEHVRDIWKRYKKYYPKTKRKKNKGKVKENKGGLIR